MDIDLDFADRNQILSLIKHTPAASVENGRFKKHNTGVYCQSIPANPLTNTASIDYKEAEKRGYFKIDFLNVSAYTGVRDEAHLNQLISTEPEWELLLEKDFSELLFHVKGHHSVLAAMKPTCVAELAAVLAMIRPAKRHLIGKSWPTVFETIWQKPDSGEYYFKCSHSHGYAMVIVMQMNLICEQLRSDYSTSTN